MTPDAIPDIIEDSQTKISFIDLKFVYTVVSQNQIILKGMEITLFV